ncbi:hypothetical protein SNOG_10054 [Parastagonospora nodorum SN15]|uniref:Uncharacterized protein n=1 Tax=Phaeosphaeria nodorum (strain SN15 / ATCC MYA-4574 / FGSC 10173) TaxID=321614 RepID=Q0UDW0_PHANO|nr:hypothetical protein SNOG_10054 [Parastagonospora nodorum SN15]EAT82389.1 hypothetical protein SNOG_10054 [Parastagonospora nodorum SN15]
MTYGSFCAKAIRNGFHIEICRARGQSESSQASLRLRGDAGHTGNQGIRQGYQRYGSPPVVTYEAQPDVIQLIRWDLSVTRRWALPSAARLDADTVEAWTPVGSTG